jgi:very-short-patch-repair endonuclease
MTTFLPNNWSAIRAFYAEHHAAIMAEEACEWAIDAYAWDERGIIHMTPIEAWLWADIRECNAIFYPQYPVGRVFVDFGNPVAKIALECDGAEFHQDWRKDEARDAELERMGWTVYRFPGWMCRTESDEETGAAGMAMARMREITEHHRLCRHHRVRPSTSVGFGRFAEAA